MNNTNRLNACRISGAAGFKDGEQHYEPSGAPLGGTRGMSDRHALECASPSRRLLRHGKLRWCLFLTWPLSKRANGTRGRGSFRRCDARIVRPPLSRRMQHRAGLYARNSLRPPRHPAGHQLSTLCLRDHWTNRPTLLIYHSPYGTRCREQDNA